MLQALGPARSLFRVLLTCLWQGQSIEASNPYFRFSRTMHADMRHYANISQPFITSQPQSTLASLTCSATCSVANANLYSGPTTYAHSPRHALMDPHSRDALQEDSSLAMLLAAQAARLGLYYMEPQDLYIAAGQAMGQQCARSGTPSAALVRSGRAPPHHWPSGRDPECARIRPSINEFLYATHYSECGRTRRCRLPSSIAAGQPCVTA